MIISVAMTQFSQVLWKIGGSSLQPKKDGIVYLAIAYITSPYILGGFMLSAIAALLWTYALTKMDFSYVGFFGSLSYIFVVLISIFIFKETIPPARWIGCAFIIVGIFFVLRS